MSSMRLKITASPSHTQPFAGVWNGPATSSNVQLIGGSLSSPNRNARHFEPRAQHVVEGRDVEVAPVLAAPSHVRAMARHAQPAEKPAGLVHDVDAPRARAVDVIGYVDLHAVGDAAFGPRELVEQ